MTDENNHINTFTATDIEKYHTGQLSAKEMHALEKAALDDPFLADALEGYATPDVNLTADIAELKKRLAEKSEKTKVIPLHGSGSSSFPWLRAAVMIVVLAGALLFSYQFFFNKSSKSISQLEKDQNSFIKTTEPGDKQQAPVKADSTDQGNTSLASGDNILLDASGNTNTGTANTPEKTKTDKDNVQERKLFFNRNPDSAHAADRFVTITAEQSAASATATIPAPDKNSKEETSTPGGTVIVDNKKIPEKESYGLREEVAFKKRADSKDITTKRTQAQPNAVLGYGYQSNQNTQGLTTVFHGQVKDANNMPLPFANVTNTRDNVGTYTDAKGNFILVSPDSVMDVQVRSLGYENSRIRLRGYLLNNPITLQEDRSLSANVLDTVKRNYRYRDSSLALEEPEPADGWSSYDSYLVNNQNDVPEAFDKKNSGSDAVELSFEVNKYGEPINIKIEKSLCDKCDKEAIRLVKEGPKWKRKAKKGKRTTVTVPFIKTD